MIFPTRDTGRLVIRRVAAEESGCNADDQCTVTAAFSCHFGDELLEMSGDVICHGAFLLLRLTVW